MRTVDLARQNSLIPAGSARTLTKEQAFKTVLLDTAAGSVVTLPPATGTGDEYEVCTSVLATSNSHKLQVANATDVFRGVIASVDTDTSDAVAWFAAATASDTITFNRSTTGSVSIGERVRVKDVKAGFWAIVDGWFGATGTPATPFSAAVS